MSKDIWNFLAGVHVGIWLPIGSYWIGKWWGQQSRSR